MPSELIPDDFVDTDKAFPDDYNPEQINLAEFTVVEGDNMSGATLVYNCDGYSLLSRRSYHNWALSMRQAYHFTGDPIPIPDDFAEYILEQIGGEENLDAADWAAKDWTYFE